MFFQSSLNLFCLLDNTASAHIKDTKRNGQPSGKIGKNIMLFWH